MVFELKYQSKSYRTVQQAFQIRQGGVASVSTFEGCMDTLDKSKPDWAVFENVPSIARESGAGKDDEESLSLAGSKQLLQDSEFTLATATYASWLMTP